MSVAGRVGRWLRERGPLWTMLWVLRALVLRLHRRTMEWIDARLLAVERHRFVVAEDSVSARRNTVEENRERWSRWDWGRGGEEWTRDAAAFRSIDPLAWKRDVVERFLRAHATKGGTTLEIGPGGGRWTEHLLEVSGEVHLVDVSQRCLDLCRERFGSGRVTCHLVEGARLDALADRSIDFVWSYDVFVHVNPVDADAYLGELARVLRPGARAVIHHADDYPTHRVRTAGFRSNLSAAFFRELCRRHGLLVLDQDRESAHKPGDCISVLERPLEAEGADGDQRIGPGNTRAPATSTSGEPVSSTR